MSDENQQDPTIQAEEKTSAYDFSKENEQRQKIETEKERAIKDRNWGYTALIWCGVVAAAFAAIFFAVATYGLIRYGMPSVHAWGDASKENAAVFKKKLPDLLDNANGFVTDGRTTMNDIRSAAVKTLAETTASERAIRTQTLPAVAGLAKQSSDTIKQIGDQTAKTVANTDSSINGKVLPEVVAVAKATTGLMGKFGLDADQAAEVIKKSGVSADKINGILASSDPKIQAALDNGVKASAEGLATLKDAHTDLHNTMKEFPAIAGNLETTTENVAGASKFAKAAAIASIIATIARGFTF